MTAPDRVKRRLQLDSPVGSSSSSSWALVTGGADKGGLKGAEFDADVYQMHVHASWNRMSKSARKMPWEFSHESVCDKLCWWNHAIPRPVGLMPPIPKFQPSTAERGREVFQATLCNRLVEPSKDIGWEPKLAAEREAALVKWTALVANNPDAWKVVDRVKEDDDESCSFEAALCMSIKDSLASRATSTLHNRAGPLIRYAMCWRDKSMKFFPVEEKQVYAFIRDGTAHAATFPRSLTMSLTFAYYVLGLKGVENVLPSGRVKGAVSEFYVTKRRLKQRPPLHLEDVKALEKYVCNPTVNQADRLAAGFFLLCIYTRCRYSDCLSIDKLELDFVENKFENGFIEGRATRCKTNSTMEKKTRFLPVVGLLTNFSGYEWQWEWMQLRKELGLDGQPGPLLPAPVKGGGFSKAPLKAGEASDWLRQILDKARPSKSHVDEGTHSLKATFLAWAARYGMSLSDRRLLGYHSASKDKSALTYSRDAASGPLRHLKEMVDAINSDVFKPDETRSGYFSRPQGVEAPQPEGVESSSSESSADEESEDHEAEEAAVEDIVGTWEPDDIRGSEDGEYFRHRVSRYLHRTADEGGSEFICGRKINVRYIRLGKRPEFMYPSCSICFK